MPMAITPSQIAASESSPPDPPPPAVPAAGTWPGSRIVCAAAGPGSVGPVSALASPGSSGGPVHGLVVPSE
jgi:hypothetical protein